MRTALLLPALLALWGCQRDPLAGETGDPCPDADADGVCDVDDLCAGDVQRLDGLPGLGPDLVCQPQRTRHDTGSLLSANSPVHRSVGRLASPAAGT